MAGGVRRQEVPAGRGSARAAASRSLTQAGGAGEAHTGRAALLLAGAGVPRPGRGQDILARFPSCTRESVPSLKGPRRLPAHPGPLPSRPGSSSLGRKPNLAWLLTSILHGSPPARPGQSTSLPLFQPLLGVTPEPVWAPATPFLGLWPDSGPSTTVRRCHPSLRPGPLERLANSESGWGPANLLETLRVREHFPGPQRSHACCLARVHLQALPAQGQRGSAPWAHSISLTGRGRQQEKTDLRSLSCP